VKAIDAFTAIKLFFTKYSARTGGKLTRLAGAHLAWIKGVCHGRAAFDITFQHKITFSLKSGNRPMKFAICRSQIN